MTPSGIRRHLGQRPWTWWFMVAVLVIVALARLRLLTFPLERDEGEYAYAGQLILQGIPPYELACNMKFPGTYLAYAVIMAVFGQTPAGIHFGLLLMTTATALMLFWLGRKALDEMAGVVAATSYALLAAGSFMLGQAGHATHFCAFFATAGLCIMWRMRQKEDYRLLVVGGGLFGMAVLMKQHAAIIAAWAGLSFAFGKFFFAKNTVGKRVLSVAVYGISMLAPLGLCCVWLWLAGVFSRFKFWTFDYAREYASITPLAVARGVFWNNFTSAMTGGIFLWLLAAVGLVVVWIDPRWQRSRVWLIGFCAASALAVCPDFYFRPHYFLIAVPSLALLAGAAVSGICQSRSGAKFMPGIYALMAAITIVTCADVWFLTPLHTLARKIYGFDPLPESEVVATFIRENSAPSARVAVLGSEPEIYFLSHRHSATGYIYVYALSEAQPFAVKMRQEMISEIESCQPEFIVVHGRGEKQSGSHPLSLFDWWENYQTNYTCVGLADIVLLDENKIKTTYDFGTNAVARHGPAHRCALEIFARTPRPVPEAEVVEVQDLKSGS